ncbi:MAG: MFS transporter, partial [Spirochaeta sp.]|nr:MFS transporter [Spirochaeta sp.]
IANLLGIQSLRLLAYTFLTTAPQILILQLSHGLTFGLYLAATVEYIHRIAPPEHRSFFQALAPSVYFGLGSIAGSWLGGIVIEAYSVLWLYRGAALLAAFGAGILFFENIYNRVAKMT